MIAPQIEPADAVARPAAKPSGLGADARYCYRCGVHELVLLRDRATAAQAAAVERGEAEFALVVDDPLIWLCYRFGEAIPWGAALFDPDDPPRAEHDPPPPSSGPSECRGLLQVRLLVGGGEALRAVRNVNLWLDFTRLLHEAIRDQARTRFDPHEHRRALQRFLKRHRSAESMVACSLARTPSGC